MNFIFSFFQSKLAAVLSTVKLKDVINQADKSIKKAKATVETPAPVLAKVSNKKEPRWQTWFPFSFVYGGGKIQPIYFFVTVFCYLASDMLYVKTHAARVAIAKGTFTADMISSADLGIVLGFISSLILLYNTNKKSAAVVQSKEEDKSV